MGEQYVRHNVCASQPRALWLEGLSESIEDRPLPETTVRRQEHLLRRNVSRIGTLNVAQDTT
jgi:hypothetical protein